MEFWFLISMGLWITWEGWGYWGRIGGMSFFPEFLTKNLYHEIELYTLMTTLGISEEGAWKEHGGPMSLLFRAYDKFL